MRTGRPVADRAVGRDCRDSGRLYATAQDGAGFGAAGADRVLGCAAGLSNKAVAGREQVAPQTVGKWRQRFVEHGLGGLPDEPRPGVPRKQCPQLPVWVYTGALRLQPLQ
jgi:hypothetical protein